MHLPFWPNPRGYRDINFGLDRVYQLLARLGNPHQKLPPVIHIAGTNGKGSTLAFLRAIFEDANLKVHTYTSPHLVRFNERIVLAGKEISDDFLNEILSKCQEAAQIEPKIDVTFFEGITVAAFLAFSKVKADVLLLEVGMGGRLDATNVVEHPLATIITPIAFDHTEFLGKTLAKIAFEKAGIIKPGVPVVISKQEKSALKVLKEVAKKNKSRAIILNDNFADLGLDLGLLGQHQKINAITAITAILAQNKFKISKENIAQGLKNAVWPARLQKINSGKFFEILNNNTNNSSSQPRATKRGWDDGERVELILDGSHNPAGAKTILDWLKTEKKINSKTKNYLICAMLKEKDSPSFLKILAKQTELLIGLEIKDEKKSKSAREIVNIAKALKINAKTGDNFTDAIEKIKKYHLQNHQDKSAKIIICGSLYLAGQFLEKN